MKFGEVNVLKMRNGKNAYGVLLGKDERTRSQLYILIWFPKGNQDDYEYIFPLHTFSRGEQEAGYKAPYWGNMLVTSGSNVVTHHGHVTPEVLYEIYKDIFESSYCGLLQKFLSNNEKDCKDFFSRFNDPKGKAVFGGQFGRL